MATERTRQQNDPVLTEKDLFDIQDEKLETAKKILLESGELASYAFMFTAIDDLSKSRGGMSAQPVNDFNESQTHAMAVLPLSGMSWKDKFIVLRNHLDKHNPDKAGVIDNLMHIGVSVLGSEEKAYKHTTRAMMTFTGATEKEIQAIAIRDACEQFGAFAVIKVDESWYLSVKAEDGSSLDEVRKQMKDIPPSEHPDSVEAITLIMETYTFSRLLKVEFFREPGHPRGKGPIAGFKEVEEHIFKVGTPDWEGWTGRFTRLLPQDRKSRLA